MPFEDLKARSKYYFQSYYRWHWVYFEGTLTLSEQKSFSREEGYCFGWIERLKQWKL